MKSPVQDANVVKIEPYITPGNEQYVHHYLMYACSGLPDAAYEQYLPDYVGFSVRPPGNIPREAASCDTVFAAWGQG